MVAISKNNSSRSNRLSLILRYTIAIALCGGLALLILVNSVYGSSSVSRVAASTGILPPPSPGKTMIRGATIQDQCRFFLAESAIPQGGLGVYTAIDIPKGTQAQSMEDICIYVADTPRRTQFETHSWARDVFMGSFEGKKPRAACEGMATLFNSMPETVATSKLASMTMHTNAGLHRAKNPGAGAVTHYYGISSKAMRDIPAGSELTIDYGDWEYTKPQEEYKAPTASVKWLQKHGMCIDNIKIHAATDPEMGRGAFARRALPKGTRVAPAPLQTFSSRQAFAQKNNEALFVNYCFQPAGTDMLLFPYGPGINLINHDSSNPNVALQWSTSSQHHGQWLDLPMEQFWKVVYPGALILEVVALRDIAQGEELFMDYGPAWEAAWQKHVQNWKPTLGEYVYPADMDTNEPFRTIKEQETNPYPPNLATACFEMNWDIEENQPVQWTMPKDWPEGLTYCHILKREFDEKSGSYLYEVSLGFSHSKPHSVDDKRYIDTKVPQHAIMMVDKPYESDMHLPNAFRHPIGFPDHLTPRTWQSAAKD